MARVLITGSTDGLGLAAARELVNRGHEVIGHARSEQRAAELRANVPGVREVWVADLSRSDQIAALADRANQSDPCDAVIHNAGIGYREPLRNPTVDGHAAVLAVNVLAPYMLTALMKPARRLVYLSSGMHRGGDDSLADVDWLDRGWNGSQAYSDSKLFDTTLAAAVARRWPQVLSNSVEPGWVATKMGGPGAPDDLAAAHLTQVWLAVDDGPAAETSGQHFYHQRARPTHPAVTSPRFQDALLDELARLTGVTFP